MAGIYVYININADNYYEVTFQNFDCSYVNLHMLCQAKQRLKAFDGCILSITHWSDVETRMSALFSNQKYTLNYTILNQ